MIVISAFSGNEAFRAEVVRSLCNSGRAIQMSFLRDNPEHVRMRRKDFLFGRGKLDSLNRQHAAELLKEDAHRAALLAAQGEDAAVEDADDDLEEFDPDEPDRVLPDSAMFFDRRWIRS